MPIEKNPQTIDQIVKSFRTYALGDIEHNKSKPIAAFILSICFIDQLSSFRYYFKIKHSKRAEQFIEDYMPAYKGLGLYNYVRNSLVHNYSSKGKFSINNKGYEDVPYYQENGKIHINTDVFVSHLTSAFDQLVLDFNEDNSEAHRNALKTSEDFPVFVDK